LNTGPITPAGSVLRMSPTFLRAWYQTSVTSFGGELSLSCRIVSDSPGLVYERSTSL
jgi:hypothetical protein